MWENLLPPTKSGWKRNDFSGERERYLGDILTLSGKIHENIEERFKKGIGKMNDILSMLNEVSFGH